MDPKRLESFAHYAAIGSFFTGFGSLCAGLFCAVVSGILLYRSSNSGTTISAQTSGSDGGWKMLISPHAVLVGILVMSLCVIFASVLNYISSRNYRRVTPEQIKAAVEDFHSKNGTPPDAPTQATTVSPVIETPITSQVFDGEIYRIATGAKGAFARETQQVIEDIMHREFAIDVDVLAELYIVNVSESTQYLRDIRASVEIDGKRVSMQRQKNFDAWELNGTDYEYCLDPTPEKTKLLLSSRTESLNALVTALPIPLESRKPLDGWIHFVLKEVNPKKLDNNQTYRFLVVDSMGKEHPISPYGGKPRPGEVDVRPKTGGG